MEFSDSEHLIIIVDGQGLDQIIEEHYPDQNYLGLVPTLLDWLTEAEERKIVWDRIAENNQIVPILMCPDDCDLWCSVIVADSVVADDIVIWQRIGLDCTAGDGFVPGKIGQEVQWFDKIKPMLFSLSEYQECVGVFKKALVENE